METSVEKPRISEVLRHFYGLEVEDDRDRWQKILCPLHPDSSPSASVHTVRERWSCFVCDVSEDGIDVIRREMEIGFREAQEFARKRFGGGRKDVFRAVSGKPGRKVCERPRFGQGGKQVRSGLRPFGSNGP
ncbi:CHC2 zinc finger domain-containing protein [Kitasatospora sp. NPDC096147]|uniref:CHC2 zinc finger domain-containing protein n=1 Tax=Kitasatospora sp. NPDC096147 TaxID=3364093 RepID=UPI003828FA78